MKKIFWTVLLVILIVPSFFLLVRPGFFPIQDDMQVFRIFEMDKCIRDFQIPCRWIPDGGYQYGYPQFNFYAPGVYYFGEVFHLVGFQFIDSIKILFILGFLFSGIAMFVLAREFFGDFPALVASLLYTYAPYRAQEVYVRGSLSEFWASVFFPLILWGLYKLINNGGKRYILWMSLAVAGLFLTHNILSFLFIPVVVFWVLFWLWKSKKLPSTIYHLPFAIILGLGLSAFFVLPMLFERGYVHAETLLGGYFDYRQHFVTVKELFFSNGWGYGSSVLGPVDDLSLSTGIVHWIVGAVAIAIALFKFRKERKISLLILGLGMIEIAVLFLMHERSAFIWSRLTFLSWLQFPWRFLSLSVFILSFLSAYVVSGLGKLKYVCGAAAVVVVLILHAGFFAPKAWLNVSDKDSLTGDAWERQLTASIFDYLPIYAKMPPDSRAPDSPEILDGNAIFINYEKGSSFQKGDAKVYKEAVVRVPLYDFPGMEVKIDGKRVNHVNNDCRQEKFCLGLITFKIPEGSHKVSIALGNTPIRLMGNTITLVSFMAVLSLLFRKKNA